MPILRYDIYLTGDLNFLSLQKPSLKYDSEIMLFDKANIFSVVAWYWRQKQSL